jgi:hypothetical protein
VGSLAGHVFLSYVREDVDEVDRLQRTLEAAGIAVWRDTANLWPGENWRLKIREAITSDALVFIACFSSRGLARPQSYQNEEVLLAVEQLRQRRPDNPWLIPVRFDDCKVPDFELGPDRALSSLQRVDLFGVNRDAAYERLVAAVLRLLDWRVQQTQVPSSDAFRKAKDLLITHLQLLRIESGNPSLSEIARLSNGSFSRNTVDDHLSGRRTGVPGWRFTSAYIQACQGFARSTGLAVERLGAMEEWQVRWLAARAGQVAASPVKDWPGMGTTDSIISASDKFGIDIPNLRRSLAPDHGMLIMSNGPDIGKCFEVSTEVVWIGRGPENNVVLPDKMVSRRHAVIRRNITAFTVRDVGSVNGTYLHQKLVIGEAPLPAGEELQIGPFRMLFIQGTQN